MRAFFMQVNGNLHVHDIADLMLADLSAIPS